MGQNENRTIYGDIVPISVSIFQNFNKSLDLAHSSLLVLQLGQCLLLELATCYCQGWAKFVGFND